MLVGELKVEAPDPRKLGRQPRSGVVLLATLIGGLPESNPSSGQGCVEASTRGCATSRRRSQNSSAVATVTVGSMNPDSSIE